MGFSMKGPSMSISYGGESNKQQKSNLMKDNPVAKHASAVHMAGKKAVAYQQEEESPLEGNKFTKAMADNDGNYDKAKAALQMKGKHKSSPVPLIDPKKLKKKGKMKATMTKKMTKIPKKEA